MPAYPPDYSAGDVVGRNLLMKPQPPATSGWPETKYTTMVTVAGADPDAPAATARATTLNKFETAWYPYTYEDGSNLEDTVPGQQFDVTLWHRNTTALRVTLTGYGGELLSLGSYNTELPTVDIPVQSEWGWTTVRLEIPDGWDEAVWVNEWGDDGHIAGIAVTVKAVTSGTTAVGWVSRIRLDRAGSVVPGYFYGATPDTETRDFDYLNAAQAAGAKAVALDSTAPAVPDSDPTITDPGPQTVKVGEPYALQVEGTDTDESWLPLTYTATGLPAGLTITTDGLISGTPTEAGTATATLTATSTAPAEATLDLPFTVSPAPDPDPDPEPDPEPEDDDFDALADALAGRVAAFIGHPDNPVVIEQARASIPVVAAFVKGYTRGHGWRGSEPAGALRSVLVSASSRLVSNPEQITYYTAADYAERPAVLDGYTVPELGVLHRYRRVSA